MLTNTIGIDLGTTTSRVGVFKSDSSYGYRVIPSVVAFGENGGLVGEMGKNQLVQDPENTIYNVKRLMGQKMSTFGAPPCQYKVKTSARGTPIIEVKSEGKKRELNPEEVTAMILMELKKSVEKLLGGSVENAVITVPAYFNDSQRQATKDAGRIAGFNKITLLNEPTAAAIAYGFDKRDEGKKNILVYDLGGGTFDVTILTVDNGVFEVKATSGDSHLGGVDFDDKLVDYFAKDIMNRYKKDIRAEPAALAQLRVQCEKSKKILSLHTETSIILKSLITDKDYKSYINRGSFEKLCNDLFNRTMIIVEDALKQSGMGKDQIDEIVVIGGCTRIPKIHNILSNFFDGKLISKSTDTDEVVVRGASIYAASLADNAPTIRVLGVTPFAIGVGEAGGGVETLIIRNSRIPVKVTKRQKLEMDRCIKLNIYEGKEVIGSFILPPAKPNMEGVDLSFEMDGEGILKVLEGTGKIVWKSGLDQADIDKMIAADENQISKDVVDKKNLKNKQLIRDVEQSLSDKKVRYLSLSVINKFQILSRSTNMQINRLKKSLAIAKATVSEADYIKLSHEFSIFNQKLDDKF